MIKADAKPQNATKERRGLKTGSSRNCNRTSANAQSSTVQRSEGLGQAGKRPQRHPSPSPGTCGHITSHGKGTLQVGLSQGP